jgi:hypothetical protein
LRTPSHESRAELHYEPKISYEIKEICENKLAGERAQAAPAPV